MDNKCIECKLDTDCAEGKICNKNMNCASQCTEDVNCKDDGVGDKREKILGSMEFDGRAIQHGPYLGPIGRLYFTGGHFGYDLVGIDGSRSGHSRAAGVFSCWPDGSCPRGLGPGP